MISMCHWYYTAGSPPFKPLCWKNLKAALRCHSANKCMCYKPSSEEYDYSRAPGRPPCLRGQ
jgi:hypothetical protein